MQVIIDVDEDYYELLKHTVKNGLNYLPCKLIANGIPLTPDVLADALMNERIRGKLKQDISYSKDIIDNVRCKLTVDIIDHRPCYCGAGLREVWRESEE